MHALSFKNEKLGKSLKMTRNYSIKEKPEITDSPISPIEKIRPSFKSP